MIELNKEYNSREEGKINKLWEESGFFNPDNLNLPKDAKTYTIILPPPNVTDRLHLGHASMIALEDLMIRYHRMKQERTLWLPGTDHAAIATQTVVEKKLYQETHQTRHDLGREEFLKKVKDFALTTQQTILGQIKSLGASLDWSRLAFTLDEPRQQAVKKMFVDMYEAGALYRGERIVNWCPRCQSTLADDEVEYQTKKTPFYYFKYGPVIIGTARPETKFADKVIIVHPKDERYKDLIGKKFIVPWIDGDVEATVIADISAEPELGTGAMTITPAHSFIDFDLAKKYNLEIIKIIDGQGNLTKIAGEFAGRNAREAREDIVNLLNKKGLVDHIDENYEHNLSVCYRCGTPIEPLPSLQWFVAVDKPLAKLNNRSLKQAALEVAEQGKIKFVPERFTKRYLDWMTNLRDWCISRQIWFGHQIPVYYKENEIYVGLEAPTGAGWQQDEDTLDTWFSSGMWTFSTLGWPNETTDLKRFHPTSVLETGYEIITLWVSRMIMMSLFAVGEIPFADVYLHGMVLDKDGKKMSKSKGNGIDPVEVSEKYGNDAVRLALLLGNTAGNDLKLSEEKIASFRNFTNKLWNISRYILSQEESKEMFDVTKMTLADKWIISKLNKTISLVTNFIDNYDFSAAGEILRSFTLDDLADWYLEASKFDNSREKNNVLHFILKNILKLWHPFMPFVTEAIWQSFNQDLLMVATWPSADEKLINEEIEKDFTLIKETIIAIRNLRSEHKLPPAEKVAAYLYAGQAKDLLEKSAVLIKSLRTGIGELTISTQGETINDSLYAISSGVEINLVATVDKVKEKQRLNNELIKITALKNNLETKLANEDFISKAPEKIIIEQKNKLVEYNLAIEKILKRLTELT